MTMRLATLEDLPTLEQIRQKAFAPVFASFRNILGEEIYTRAQEPEDDQQSEILKSLFEPDSTWKVYVMEFDNKAIGFVSIQLNMDTLAGEIGLNAIDPEYAGKGLGTNMYEFALQEMKSAGIRVATVATGGDISHAPARRAYEKAGFNVQIPSVWMCREL